MASVYRIKIIKYDGSEVVLHPGGRGERDLVDAIIAKGVGFFTTEAQVREAIESVLFELKSEVVPT